jgi:hypothetical protein
VAEFLSEMKKFGYEVIRFEKKKLILPVLAVMVILSAVLILGQMRSQGVDEKAVNSSVTAMTGLTVVFIEAEHFNDSIDKPRRQRRKMVYEKAERIRPDFTSSLMTAEGFLLGSIYLTPFFPVAPGGLIVPSMTGVGESKALLFPSTKGYYLTEEAPEALVMISYRQKALNDLGERVNKTNMTLEEFRNRVESIKSTDLQSRELKRTVLNQSELRSSRKFSGMVGNLDSGFDQSDIERQVVEGEIKEIGLIHFIPAMFIAFTWNYLLSGLLITVFRRLRNIL